MSHRLTTLALTGVLLLGAAACADSSDGTERVALAESAAAASAPTTAPEATLDSEGAAALLDVIADVADIASTVPDLLGREPAIRLTTSGDFELSCAGGLEPTVLFVGRAAATWPDVDHGELSARLFGARVCTYDAATEGRPEPTTPAEVAAEAAVASADIRATGSVTVVGRSDASEAAELFADQHPADAVGLTIVEPDGGWADITWRDLYGR